MVDELAAALIDPGVVEVSAHQHGRPALSPARAVVAQSGTAAASDDGRARQGGASLRRHLR